MFAITNDFFWMTFLNEQILNKDEELAVKKNKVIITFMLIVLFRGLPSRGIDRQ